MMIPGNENAAVIPTKTQAGDEKRKEAAGDAM